MKKKGKRQKKKEKKEERGTKKAKRGNRRKGKNFKKVLKDLFLNWHTNHIPRNKRKNAKAGHLQTSKKRHPHSKHFLPRACLVFFTLFT